MSNKVANIALERAKKLREEGKKAVVAPIKPTAKKNGKSKTTRTRKTDIPYAKVAQLYDAGKSVSEISDTMGWTDKKSDWPYSYTYGILKRLRAGVEINGRTVKVKPKR